VTCSYGFSILLKIGTVIASETAKGGERGDLFNQETAVVTYSYRFSTLLKTGVVIASETAKGGERGDLFKYETAVVTCRKRPLIDG